MKTKIILLIIAVKALSITATFGQDKAQQSFYLRIYGGYSVFTPGSDLLGSHSGDVGLTSGSFTQSKQGAGAGPNYGFGLSVPINTSWMAGIDANYLNGKTIKFHATEVYNVGGYDSNNDYSVNARHSVWTVTPNISYKVITKARYFVYTKLGMIVAVNTKADGGFNSHDILQDPTGPGLLDDVSHYQSKYGLNMGVQTAAGVQLKVTHHISIFGELTGNFLTLRPKSSVSNEVSTAVDNLGTTVYIYNDNITYNRSSNFSTGPGVKTTTVNGSTTTDNYTATLPAPKEHVNSVVLNVGIAVGF